MTKTVILNPNLSFFSHSPWSEIANLSGAVHHSPAPKGMDCYMDCRLRLGIPEVLEVQGAYHGLIPQPKICLQFKKKTRVFDRQLSGSQTVKQKKGVVFDIYSCCLLQLEVISKKTLTNVFPSDLDVSQLQYIIITKSYIITFPTLRPWSIQQNC